MRILSLFLLATLLWNCSKKGEEAVNPENPTAVAGNELDAAVILQIVNKVRQEGCTCNGKAMPAVAPYTWNRELEKAALAHSQDMRDKNYFSHTGSDGSSFGQRAQAHGYTGRAMSENIALGYANEQAVINGWLSSTQGHCEALMRAGHNELGIGRKGSYWTMIMGQK